MDKKVKDINEIRDRFKNRLIRNKLENFKLLGIDEEGMYTILHTTCGSNIKVDEIDKFFKRKNKCKTCYQYKLNERFQAILNVKFNSEIELLSDYKTIYDKVKLRHINSGTIFFKMPRYLNSVNNIFDLRINENKILRLFEAKLSKERLLDYKIIDYDNNDNFLILHNVCGSTIEDRYEKFFRKKIKCKICHQKRLNINFQDYLNNKFNKKLILLDDYINTRKRVRVRHSCCGSIFYKIPEEIKSCEDISEICKCGKLSTQKELVLNESEINKKNRKFDAKLIENGLLDFKRIGDYTGYDKEITLHHIKCKRTFKVTPNNFFKRKNKCVCFSDFKKVTKAKPKNEYYQNKLNELTNKQFKLLSDYYNLNSYIELKHLECGHIFEVRADNFENAIEKCPNCSNRELMDSLSISEKIKILEGYLNNEYEILNKFFTSDDIVRVRHRNCEHEFECSGSSIYKSKNKKIISCPECDYEDRRENFLDRLSSIQGDDFSMSGKYKGMTVATTFKHRVCGHRFKYTPNGMLKKKMDSCPGCREQKKEENFKQKFKEYYSDKYSLIGKYNSTKVTLKHNVCGTEFNIYLYQLFKKQNICKCKK